MYIDIYRFRFVTVFEVFFFFRLLFSGSINDVILVLGDCHVLLDQGNSVLSQVWLTVDSCS